MFNLNTKEGEAYMLPVKIKVFKNDDSPETKKEPGCKFNFTKGSGPNFAGN
jgi:hypothetical protein